MGDPHGPLLGRTTSKLGDTNEGVRNIFLEASWVVEKSATQKPLGPKLASLTLTRVKNLGNPSAVSNIGAEGHYTPVGGRLLRPSRVFEL